MLREQRYALFSDEYCIESYVEESVSDTFDKIIEKLRNLMKTVHDKIFSSVEKKKVEDVPDDAEVVVDTKEYSKMRKVLQAIRKVLTMPIKAIISAVKHHALLITTILAATIGVLYIKKDKEMKEVARKKQRIKVTRLKQELRGINNDLAKCKAKVDELTTERENLRKQYCEGHGKDLLGRQKMSDDDLLEIKKTGLKMKKKIKNLQAKGSELNTSYKEKISDYDKARTEYYDMVGNDLYSKIIMTLGKIGKSLKDAIIHGAISKIKGSKKQN